MLPTSEGGRGGSLMGSMEEHQPSVFSRVDHKRTQNNSFDNKFKSGWETEMSGVRFEQLRVSLDPHLPNVVPAVRRKYPGLHHVLVHFCELQEKL